MEDTDLDAAEAEQLITEGLASAERGGVIDGEEAFRILRARAAKKMRESIAP